MGRRQFLERLALGRSPFEDVDEGSPSSQGSHERRTDIQIADQESNDSDTYVQQYDSRGRPINPSVDRFNAEMRAAQNEALELVGVVERKDASDRFDDIRQKIVTERRKLLLAEENERGELLDFVLTPVRFLARVWADAFVHRIQIGFYDPSSSMADILRSEWRERWMGGFKMSLATRFPAMADIIAHGLIRIPLTVAAEQLTGRLQVFVQDRFPGRKNRTGRRLFYATSALFEVLLVLIDVAILPIEYYAFAQRLSLAPPLPLFPPLKFMLPWNAQSFHRIGWGTTWSRIFISPAFLLMAYKIFHYDEDAEEDIPICALITNYRYPAINDDPQSHSQPSATTDPIGYILHKGYLLRSHILRWCGWTLVKDPTSYRHALSPTSHEENTLQSPSRHPLLQDSANNKPTYRSTHLAHMPAQHLANAIDKLYSRILILPFESFILRAIAATYLSPSSPLPKTTAALSAAPRLFASFGPNPLSALFRAPVSRASWSSLGTYLSHLSLALSLTTSIDILLALLTTSTARQIGISYFNWGNNRTFLETTQMKGYKLDLTNRTPPTDPEEAIMQQAIQQLQLRYQNEDDAEDEAPS